jgi:hypothetical protein
MIGSRNTKESSSNGMSPRISRPLNGSIFLDGWKSDKPKGNHLKSVFAVLLCPCQSWEKKNKDIVSKRHKSVLLYVSLSLVLR